MTISHKSFFVQNDLFELFFQGLIFVVDSNDRERAEEARDELSKMVCPDLQIYSKTCVKRPLSKRLKIVFQDQLSLNAGH